MAHTRLALILSSVVLASGSGCGGDSEAGPIADGGTLPDAIATQTGALRGTVRAVLGDTPGVLSGAVISIDGVGSTTSDASGVFTLSNVPKNVPLIAHVTGPEFDPTTDPLPYSSADYALTLTDDADFTLSAYLLPGCLQTLASSSGGTLDLEGCGTATSASLEFPADAFVSASGQPFEGIAQVEASVLDPAAMSQRLALGDSPAGIDLRGFIEVRLYDSQTHERLQIAPGKEVTVRVPIADDVSSVHVWDPARAAWEAHDRTPIVRSEEDARLGEFVTTHFTSFSLGGPVERDDHCTRFRALVCSGSTCEPARGGSYDILLHGSGRHLSGILGASKCIDLPEGVQFNLHLEYVDLGGTVYEYTSVFASGATGDPSCSEDVGSCDDLGELRLYALPKSCVTGQFLTRDGEPVTGIVSLYADETRVGHYRLPEECGGNFCFEVPYNSLALRLESAHGNLDIDVTPTTRMSCDRTNYPANADPVCSENPGCQQVSGEFSCSGGTCVTPVLSACSRENSYPLGSGETCATGLTANDEPQCGQGEYADRPYVIEADATLSTGSIGHYRWYLLDESGNVVETAHSVASEPVHYFCAAEGIYTVVVTLMPPLRYLPVTTTATVAAGNGHLLTVTVVGNGTVTSTPSGIACGADQTCRAYFLEGHASRVELAATPTQAANVHWSGDCEGVDGDGSPTGFVVMDGNKECSVIFETPSVDFIIQAEFDRVEYYPDEIFTGRITAYNSADHMMHPIAEVFPNVQRCDWNVTYISNDGVTTHSMFSKTACANPLFGPSSVSPDVVLQSGTYGFEVIAYLDNGLASSRAAAGFVVR